MGCHDCRVKDGVESALRSGGWDSRYARVLAITARDDVELRPQAWDAVMMQPAAIDPVGLRGRGPVHGVAGHVVTAVVVAVTSLAAYLLLLGWDQQKTLGADGYLHGPYEAWQVAALVVVLAVGAAWSGWRHHSVVGASVAATTLTAIWSTDAATDSENDGLWPVGALLVAIATMGGFLLVAAIASRVARSRI